MTMKKSFPLFQEKAEEIYGDEGAPLSKQKDDTENSTQFFNNNTKIISVDDQKLIDKAKKMGSTIKTKLWHSLKQAERMQIIAKQAEIKTNQSNKEQIPK